MPYVQSLNFCEIGNIDDPITDSGKKRLEAVLCEVFSTVFGKGTTKGTPQIIWPETKHSTTCAAWRGDVRVERLSSFKIPTLPVFRSVERTLLTSAAEHGNQKLMVYNTHQPASTKRPFPPTSRLKCANAIIATSIRDMSDMDGIVAVICIGDPNLSRSVWQTALVEVRILTLNFAKTSFVFAT